MTFAIRTGDEIILPDGEVRAVIDANFLPEHMIYQLLTKDKRGEYQLFWVMEELGDDTFEVHDMWNEPHVVRRVPSPMEKALLQLRKAVYADQYIDSGEDIETIVSRIYQLAGLDVPEKLDPDGPRD